MTRTLIVLAAMTLAGMPLQAQERQPGEYPLTGDSQPHEGIAHGEVRGPFEFHSEVFAGTVRQYWVYVPAGYDPADPPNLLVFQDGHRAVRSDGVLRVPIVLDNLIAKGDIPPTIGLFVTPGNLSQHFPELGWNNPDHRWQEYDELDDDYSRLIIGEMLPLIARDWSFSDNPAQRAIGGTSSGAIAAFTVAWRHPEAFGNVISMIGSYTSIAAQYSDPLGPPVPAGDLYPRMIRLSPPRPLRIFLQDGSNDLDNQHGNWFLANQQMLAALEYANRAADARGESGPRYEVAHVWGDGGHSDSHGGAILPDILRWLWGEPATD
ncbi:MAG TPA: alpha/beta hydrolase-fold protein [Sphingomonadaceae bacterium]|nr:alpha/beta hydrolase-fold protein [Sphingomonadaceae bacterium]